MREIVKVFWRDISGINSSSNSSSWFTLEQIKKEAQHLYDKEYISVGEIIFENEEYIILSATTDNETYEDIEKLYTDASMIMKSVIIRIEHLTNLN